MLVKTLLWLRNVSIRTLHGFLPFLSQPDDDLAQRILSAKEYQLYLSMDKRDREHATLVTKALIQRYPEASARLLRAALLHDIGKSQLGFCAAARILVHLYTPSNLPASPRLKGLRGMWQQNLHHASYGAELILETGGCPDVAEIVARHHAPKGHSEAAQLKSLEDLF